MAKVMVDVMKEQILNPMKGTAATSRSFPSVIALSLVCAFGLASSDASAMPPPRPEMDAPGHREMQAGRGDRDGRAAERQTGERRERVLRRIRVLKAVELGEVLELDAAGMVRLTQMLEGFDEERQQIRRSNLEIRQALRQVARGEATGDAATLARQAADNRVRLAEIDRRELEAVLIGLPPDKAAKATLFLSEFPRRVERLADRVKRGKRHRGPGREADSSEHPGSRGRGR